MTLSGIRILVVEDAPDLLEVFVMLLRIEGADVAGAATGREALAIFAARQFDVVVTDLALPDVPGDLLIRTMVATARQPVDVVVVTGDSGPASARALAAGARIVFSKPCDWARVLDDLGRRRFAAAA